MTRAKIIYLLICLFLVVLIFYRYGVVLGDLENSELNQYNDSSGDITLIGRIVKEPDIRENSTKLTIKTEQGKILVTVNRYLDYQYNDEVKITGLLETPVSFEDFDYRQYLLKDGIISVSYNPRVELVHRKTSLYGFILNFKDKVRGVIKSNLSPPQSEILGAMILGDKNQMSLELKEKLNVAGVRHIAAISGLHILILSSIIMSLLLALGMWRNQAFYLSVTLIFLFIAMIGFQPSAVRAGIMGGLFLFANKIGRTSTSARSIIIAGGIMLVINPLLLFYDVGFQLSFLASFGIIYLSSFFNRLFRVVPSNLRNILVPTFSAYAFTLPILIYSFGQISLIGPLANILIIPIIYLTMIFGLAFALVGLIIPFLAQLLVFPVWVLLSYIVSVVDLLSFDGGAKTIDNIHWYWLLLFYLFLFILVWHYNKNNQKDYL